MTQTTDTPPPITAPPVPDDKRVQIMLDLETLGTTPGSIVWEIGGAVIVNAEIAAFFHLLIDVNDAGECGLQIDAETLGWWMEQEDAAIANLKKALTGAGEPLRMAMEKLSNWIAEICQSYGDPHPLIWGNGANFDPVLLGACFEVLKMPVPWDGRDVRCYRTLKNLLPMVKVEREGVAHRADDDARHQARHLIALQAFHAEMLNAGGVK